MPTLHWIGKEKVISQHHDVPFRVLVHQYGLRTDNPNDKSETYSGNKIIHGDNLEALKALLPEYEGKIDCIYIDPPYNTGNEGWVYNDNVNDPHIKKWLGEVVGQEGEDFSRHDKWLCMMYPRLQLMRQLLSDNGVIFISNDDNEQAVLKIVCDEIFGRSCFVNNIIWQKTYSPRNDSDGIPMATDYITVYSRKSGWNPKKLERTEDMDAKYSNIDNDYVPWTSSDAFAAGASTHQGMVYAIQHPFNGTLIYPYSDAHWRYSQNEMLSIMNGWCEYELKDLDDAEKRAAICNVPIKDVRQGVKAIVLKNSLEESRIVAQTIYKRGQWPKFYFTKGGFGGIRRKTYLNAVEGKLVTNFWPYSEVDHTDGAKKELKRIFEGAIPFDTPKPSKLIDRIIEISTHENSIILDCFAGSATTAHAIISKNKKDNGNRKFILVEMMDYAETITAERVRRVMTGYEYKGKKEEEIYSKKLTPKNILQADTILAEAQQIAKLSKDNYDKIGKPKIEDNCLKVIGTKVYTDRMEGLGGSFDYYELGAPLFNDDDTLNEEVGEARIREYIYYTETREHLTRKQNETYPYLLDYHNDVGYFFYYKKDELTELSYDTLNIVPMKADHYVIYADTCAISKEELAKMNISFKKIPRDINRF